MLRAGIVLLTLVQVGVLHVAHPPGPPVVAVAVHQHLRLPAAVVAAAQDALAAVAHEELVKVFVARVVPRPQVEADRRHVRVRAGLIDELELEDLQFSLAEFVRIMFVWRR